MNVQEEKKINGICWNAAILYVSEYIIKYVKKGILSKYELQDDSETWLLTHDYAKEAEKFLNIHIQYIFKKYLHRKRITIDQKFFKKILGDLGEYFTTNDMIIITKQEKSDLYNFSVIITSKEY